MRHGLTSRRAQKRPGLYRRLPCSFARGCLRREANFSKSVAQGGYRKIWRGLPTLRKTACPALRERFDCRA